MRLDVASVPWSGNHGVGARVGLDDLGGLFRALPILIDSVIITNKFPVVHKFPTASTTMISVPLQLAFNLLLVKNATSVDVVVVCGDDVVEGVPAHGQGGWTAWSLRSLPTQTILGFCAKVTWRSPFQLTLSLLIQLEVRLSRFPRRVSEFSCHISGCCQVFDTLEGYEHHYNALHRNVCSFCKRSFPSGNLLDIHILEWHDSLFQIMAEKQNMYKCLVEGCPEKFKSSKDRKDHLVTVHLYPADFRFDRPKKVKSVPKHTSCPTEHGPSVPMEVSVETAEQLQLDPMETGPGEDMEIPQPAASPVPSLPEKRLYKSRRAEGTGVVEVDPMMEKQREGSLLSLGHAGTGHLRQQRGQRGSPLQLPPEQEAFLGQLESP
ncbi:hypothetical protein BTVI_25174 [Pitangus sulphuratus]|nr:hypothetical protein BTVI_25174 [Pitangus sulphuratus]